MIKFMINLWKFILKLFGLVKEEEIITNADIIENPEKEDNSEDDAMSYSYSYSYAYSYISDFGEWDDETEKKFKESFDEDDKYVYSYSYTHQK